VSFGLTFDKLLLIGIIAVFLLGPERLPHHASQLARLVRSLRTMANGAKNRMREEMGPDFDDFDWKKLDPRQYDPRQIIRDALAEDDTPDSRGWPKVSATAHEAGPTVYRPETAYAERQRTLRDRLAAPHDSGAS